MHFACAALVDSPTCVEMLIQRGAKVNIQDHKKNTPAMVAAFFNKPKILQYLIDQGADLTLRNNEDKDCYAIADEKDHYDCKSVITKHLDRMGFYRKNSIDDSLAKNFETKNKIR